jgi:hypothetical protein
MTFATIQNGSPSPLPTSDITVGDVQFSYSTMLLWTDAERASYGIYPIVDDAIPAGKVSTGSTLEKVGNVVQRHWTLADAPPPPVPQTISDRQFAQVLAMDGLITEEDALAWVKVGTVPARLQALVDAIPDAAARFSANMLLGGATEFRRDHPMVSQLGAGLAMTDAQIDDIWRIGATL